MSGVSRKLSRENCSVGCEQEIIEHIPPAFIWLIQYRMVVIPHALIWLIQYRMVVRWKAGEEKVWRRAQCETISWNLILGRGWGWRRNSGSVNYIILLKAGTLKIEMHFE